MPMSPRLLRPILSGDPDALRYIAAVQQADQQSLEPAVRKAITDFVVGCKQDNIWNAIRASCILMGARTLSGALTPLKGGAPTNVNNNFVSGDYNRETGLVGDGVGKHLDSNRNNNADPQNSFHMCVYASTLATNNVSQMGAGAGGNGASQIFGNASTLSFRARAATQSNSVGDYVAGFLGINRSVSTTQEARANGVNLSGTVTSQTPHNGNILVFCRGGSDNTPGFFAASRIAFYSIGEALTLSTLESRVIALYNAIGAAI
jgi:hypothetical protein